MAMKKRIVLLMAAFVLALSACSTGAVEFADRVLAAQQEAGTAEEVAVVVSEQTVARPLIPASVEYDRDDLGSSVSDPEPSYIRLAGDAVTIEGEGATVNGSSLTIHSAGTYKISGILNDGQIIVDTQDKETVHLVLDGVDITSSTSAPIYVANAEKTVITLSDSTENYVSDGVSYAFEDADSDEPNAAVFSKDDLTINGGGSLVVDANFDQGIVTKDDLKITGGNITVNAVNDGIRGRDSVAVLYANITVSAGGDGIQANNDEDVEKGTVSIEGGTVDITAGLDGIQAETSLLISGGQIKIVAGGGSVDSGGGSAWGGPGMGGNANKTAESAKGLKAGVDLTITEGVIQVSSLDDAIHSNGSITIDGGSIVLASGDDGIHADASLIINGGDVSISQSYEGLESRVITINDGTIHLTASDDGINGSSGNDGVEAGAPPMWGGGPGGFGSDDSYVYLHGGVLAIDARGDGIDANGSIEMTGGTVIVNGPTNDGNGSLDYLGTFDISGGYLVAVGSSGMAQAPSTTSTQYSVLYSFASPQAAGTIVHIETESGQDVLTFAPVKQYQSVVLSSPELESGSSLVVYAGGSSSGAVSDGLYAGGVYSGGTRVDSLTISGVVTTGGSAAGGFPGGRRGRP